MLKSTQFYMESSALGCRPQRSSTEEAQAAAATTGLVTHLVVRQAMRGNCALLEQTRPSAARASSVTPRQPPAHALSAYDASKGALLLLSPPPLLLLAATAPAQEVSPPNFYINGRAFQWRGRQR